MSVNHNRIKVADLEKNEPNKILTTNDNGELIFSDIKKDNYNDLLVNDLSSGGTTKALTAEMGKVLQNNKVDKVIGKTLSTEDYSTAEKSKLFYIDQTKDIEKPVSSAQQVAFDLKQDIANQIEVSTSQNAQASWHGKTVFFKTNITINIPASGLPAGFTFEGVTLPGCTLTWTITSPKVWAFGTPPTIVEKNIFTLMQQMTNSNNIYLFGV